MAAMPFLQDIARIGGGRTFLTDGPPTLPTLLVDEAQAVIQPYIVEEQLYPGQRRAAPDPPRHRANPAAERVRYYLATPERAGAAGYPRVATRCWPPGQYGLGRALAWTSDLKGQWAADWVGWPGLHASPRSSSAGCCQSRPART